MKTEAIDVFCIIQSILPGLCSRRLYLNEIASGYPEEGYFLNTCHCAKSVRIQNYIGPYFPAFGLNTETYGVSHRIQSKCGKIRIRITPNMDTFHAVCVFFTAL